ncbi:MFS transporter [Streptococcus sp. S784/96/1]|uniref:MFS transporter n=1 Tax=Streptococcus sp. S784/96/1 TaxID=2653499 RepID=UPI001389BD87|nr:MFS transporter [Streptococcus sp. S784/96/1]
MYNKWRTTFYTITLGEMVSTIGSSAVQFSLIWWLTDVYKSVNVMVIAALFTFLPNVLLGPLAGVLVDKLKRKFVIITSDLFSGVLAVFLALFFSSGHSSYAIVCLTLGLRTIASAFQIPAIKAVMPVLVPKEELTRANSISEFIDTGCNLLGPILGAFMISVLPINLILLTDLVGAIIACIAVSFAKIPEINSDSNTNNLHIIKSFKDVFNFFKSDKKLNYFTKLFFICTTLYMPLGMLFPLMVKQTFSGDSILAGGAQFFYTLGMLIAALTLGIFSQKVTDYLKLATYGLSIFAISLILSGILPGDRIGGNLFLVLCLFMGIGVNLSNIPYITYLQSTLPKEHQGKIMSFYQMLISIAMPLGLIVTTPANKFFTLAMWFSASGIIMIIGILVYHFVKLKYDR